MDSIIVAMITFQSCEILPHSITDHCQGRNEATSLVFFPANLGFEQSLGTLHSAIKILYTCQIFYTLIQILMFQHQQPDFYSWQRAEGFESAFVLHVGEIKC